MMHKIMNFIKDEDGLELSEYAVMAALIALAVIVIVTTLGTTIRGVFTELNAQLLTRPPA